MRVLATLLATAVCVAAAASTSTAPVPARHIRIHVMVQGEVILEGGFSDAGRQDADDVWRAVTAAIGTHTYSTILSETKAFKPEFVKQVKDDQYVLTAPNKGKVTFRIAFGGQTDVRELKLTKVQDPKRAGRNAHIWRLDATQIKGRFAVRMIGRTKASQLKNVQRLKF